MWNIITLYTLAVRPVILAEAFLFYQFSGLPQCGSDTYTLSFQNRALSKIAGQPMWDLHVVGKVAPEQVLSMGILVFPCQYHCTDAPYSCIYLLPTLYGVITVSGLNSFLCIAAAAALTFYSLLPRSEQFPWDLDQ